MNNMPLLTALALESLGVRYRERDCIVCHRKFLQRMKINDQGKPVEPLIEDEKIRKALRAVYDAAPHRDNVVYFDGRWTFRGDKFEVMFDDREIKIEGWTEGKAYHIEELCGKDKE